jgi:hypothetical protein
VVVGLIALIAIAFLVAAQGLDWLYQDRVSLLGNFGALVVTLGALTTFFAGFAAPVFVGSAMLLWDLARIGVVSRLVPIVHVATAILFVFGQIGFDLGGLGVIVAASFTLFVVTWGAIGVSLIRVVPQTQAPSA